MTCSRCQQDWCWICNAKIGRGGGDHFNPLRPGHCAQFSEQTEEELAAEMEERVSR